MANAHAKPHHDYHLVNPSPWLFLFACIYVLAVASVCAACEKP